MTTRSSANINIVYAALQVTYVFHNFMQENYYSVKML